MKKNILVLGAASDMAMAIAEEYAKNGFGLYLAARNSERLQNFKSDKEVRYSINVELLEFDVLTDSISKEIIENVDVVVSAIGYLGDQQKGMSDWQESQAIINLNFTALVKHLNSISLVFSERKSGTIIGISSVAGDRGRGSNFLYGSSKAAFSAYLSGLRNDLFKSGVHVMTVKPGFVRTKMTSHLELPNKLTADPENVASAVFKGFRKKKNTIYVLGIWFIIMNIIKVIPEGIFKKMKL